MKMERPTPGPIIEGYRTLPKTWGVVLCITDGLLLSFGAAGVALAVGWRTRKVLGDRTIRVGRTV